MGARAGGWPRPGKAPARCIPGPPQATELCAPSRADFPPAPDPPGADFVDAVPGGAASLRAPQPPAKAPMPALRILILDDEPKMGPLLRRSLERDGYEVEAFEEPAAALERLREAPFDALVTDLRMPGLDGLEVLRRAKAARPAIEVVLMTAYASVETARQALLFGAADYLVKPVSAEEDLKPLLRRLLAEPAPSAEPPRSAPSVQPAGISSRNPAMAAILAKLDRIARSNATVLLRGESGVGKEVVADLIQARSLRAGKPYLKVNCGALPESLLESELFGHAKGAFTGASSDREGLFAAADGGTVLLDEVGEVSPRLQVKLLRVLQGGDFTRVGDSAPRRADVRVIAATNRDLARMIEAGEFREDLYYRLNVVPLELPPLRDRLEDLEDLVAEFVRRHAPPGPPPAFAPEAMEALRAYHWPGNIRELENAVEHALVLGDPSGIVVDDLPQAVQQQRRASAPAAVAGAPGETLEDIEKRCLLNALAKTGGNRTRAARLLGLTRRTLGYRIRKHGLEEEADAVRPKPDSSSNS